MNQSIDLFELFSAIQKALHSKLISVFIKLGEKSNRRFLKNGTEIKTSSRIYSIKMSAAFGRKSSDSYAEKMSFQKANYLIIVFMCD